jgi:hypothetical protein
VDSRIQEFKNSKRTSSLAAEVASQHPWILNSEAQPGSLPKVSFDAPHFQDIAFAPQILVRWLSGRKRRFAKALYLLSGTEGSNPSLTVVLSAFPLQWLIYGLSTPQSPRRNEARRNA